MVRGSCGAHANGVEITSPSETGTTRRKLRGVGETGKPGSFAGGWHRRAARSAVLAGWVSRATGRPSWATQPGKPGVRRGRTRPPPSHTWRGPCSILPDRREMARTDTPEFAGPPSALYGPVGGPLWTRGRARRGRRGSAARSPGQRRSGRRRGGVGQGGAGQGAIARATSARAGDPADSWTQRANSHSSTRSGSRPSRPAIRRARPRGFARSRSSQLSMCWSGS
jgi:hypothetical protein